MMREVLQVKKCTPCGTVLQALVRDEMMGDDGDLVVAVYWLPRQVHTAADCTRSLALFREEWPTLFELEAGW